MKRTPIFCAGLLLLSTIVLFGQSTPAPVQQSLQSPEQSPEQSNVPPSPVPLDAVVQEALQKNPGVQAAQRQYEALRHRVPQAKSFPDPEVSVGWMGNITPFSVQEGDPSSYRGVGAMQNIAYPGKLKLRGEVASKEADAAYWDYEAVRRRIAADVKSAYYDYFFYDKAI